MTFFRVSVTGDQKTELRPSTDKQCVGGSHRVLLKLRHVNHKLRSAEWSLVLFFLSPIFRVLVLTHHRTKSWTGIFFLCMCTFYPYLPDYCRLYSFVFYFISMFYYMYYFLICFFCCLIHLVSEYLTRRDPYLQN